MIFDDVVAGADLFVDADTFVYHKYSPNEKSKKVSLSFPSLH
jgi:hypothetical protein